MFLYKLMQYCLQINISIHNRHMILIAALYDSCNPTAESMKYTLKVRNLEDSQKDNLQQHETKISK